jgi:fructokinase
MTEPAHVSALCFGEILWDFLPDALHPGGAPFNVAYHLHHHNVAARLVSAIGRDLLGEELIRRLTHFGLSDENVARHATLPTGFVRATLGASRDAQYEITPGVAWDEIPVNEGVLTAAATCRALVFGSLAQRSPYNRSSLQKLLTVVPPSALVIFDVNLRPPHDDLALVRDLARHATVLKLNAAEAARMIGDPMEKNGREKQYARSLAETTGCAYVCITAGARGAGLLHDGRWYWEAGRSVAVQDTVGAGDAFLGALVARLIHSSEPAVALAAATRCGEWVAGQRGATPKYPHSGRKL